MCVLWPRAVPGVCGAAILCKYFWSLLFVVMNIFFFLCFTFSASENTPLTIIKIWRLWRFFSFAFSLTGSLHGWEIHPRFRSSRLHELPGRILHGWCVAEELQTLFKWWVSKRSGTFFLRTMRSGSDPSRQGSDQLHQMSKWTVPTNNKQREQRVFDVWSRNVPGHWGRALLSQLSEWLEARSGWTARLS